MYSTDPFIETIGEDFSMFKSALSSMMLISDLGSPIGLSVYSNMCWKLIGPIATIPALIVICVTLNVEGITASLNLS